MMMLAQPSVDVVGISAVHGNVGVAQVGQNIARVLTLCGRPEVPFYLGADEPLVAPAMDASYFHGLDGLGDVPDVFPTYASVELQPQQGHAAVHLARAAQVSTACAAAPLAEPLRMRGCLIACLSGRPAILSIRACNAALHSPVPKRSPCLHLLQEHEGELTVVATGPLTNICLACKFDEHFPSKGEGQEPSLPFLATSPLPSCCSHASPSRPLAVARLIVMGGAEGKGNVTPTAEYNAHCDAEAAHVVMRKFREVVLVR